MEAAAKDARHTKLSAAAETEFASVPELREAARSAGSRAMDSSAKPAVRDVPWVSLEHQRALRAKTDPSMEERAAAKKQRPKKTAILDKFVSNSKPELSANKFEYLADENKTLVASGKAVLSDANMEVNADKIEYSQAHGFARASGEVSISTDMFRVVADDLFVDYANNSMASKAVKMGSQPIFLSSEGFSGNREKIEIKDATIYFGEPSFMSLRAKAGSISYDTKTELLQVEDATIGFGPIPVFYVPYYSQHGLEKPPFYLRTSVGLNDDYGLFMRNTVMYTGFDWLSAGLLLDGYTKRSVLVGPAAEYDLGGSDSFLNGWVQGAYINDNGGTSILGRNLYGKPIDNQRFFAEWRNRARYRENMSLTTSLSAWSDQYVTRDFRPDFFYENQTPDNFAEARYDGSFWSASLFTRFQPNSWEFVQQRLPEIGVNMQPVEILKTGAYHNLEIGYTHLRQFNPDGRVVGLEDYLSTNRVNAYYGLERPVQLNSWSKITPVVGGMATYYSNAVNGRSDYARFLGQFGVDAQADIWGVSDFKSPTLGIDGLRHHIMPVLSYRCIPAAEQGSAYIPQIDSYYPTTYPPVLDLGALRNTDEILKTNTLRIGVKNVFETRDAEYGSREIARFDVFEDFNFDKRYIVGRDTPQNWSDLYINASVSPSRLLTLGSYVRVNPDNARVPEVTGYATVFEGDALTLNLLATYFEGMEGFEPLTQYTLEALYRISEIYRLRAMWSYNYRTSTFTNQTYSLMVRLGSAWTAEIYVSERSGSTRQDNFSISCSLSMQAF